jgi:hypothetical protein
MLRETDWTGNKIRYGVINVQCEEEYDGNHIYAHVHIIKEEIKRIQENGSQARDVDKSPASFLFSMLFSNKFPPHPLIVSDSFKIILS